MTDVHSSDLNVLSAVWIWLGMVGLDMVGLFPI